MRIALLAQSYPPMVSGAAIVAARLAEGLAARGHAVLVLAASDTGHAYGDRRGSLQVSRLRAYANPARVGQHFLLWPERDLAQELRRFQPQVIHAHDPLVMSLACLRAWPGRPRVLTLHQLPWFVTLLMPNPLRRVAERALWQYGRWLYGKFDQIVTPSQMIADTVAMHTGARPLPISNGVDTERFNPQPASGEEAAALRARYNLDPRLPVVLYTGRVDADKRVDLVVQAAALAVRNAAAQLLIAGDGRELPKIKRLAQQLGLAELSRFPGYVPAAGDLPGLYRLAAVFVTASEVEIQSSVVLEAAASGLPVVTVQASSMPEFVQEGRTGHLVPPGDVAALAHRLAGLIQNPGQARAMGRAALELARRHSHIQAVAAHEQLYESLLKRRL